MKKVAFYLNNPSMKGCNYSDIQEGNPGIAGSEYEYLLVSYLLDIRSNGIDVFLLTNASGVFPHKNVVKVENLSDASLYCKINDINIIVLDIKYFEKNILDRFSDFFSVIIWAHNDVGYKNWNLLNSLKYITRVVNVGREQMELYRDHPLTNKSTYIYNIFPLKARSYYTNMIDQSDNHNVVYMGSIVKQKGFHYLARSWKKIIKAIPDAQLYVIGSGNLYNRETKLGKYGIAEESYEKMFIPYITNEQGEILPSVHFLGLLGDEKYSVMGKCKVGVPNPTGSTETFCICAIEMQLMGCNITSIAHSAYYDTVMNKTYLYKSERDLSKFVIRRLLSTRDDVNTLYDFIENNFCAEKNIVKWEDLLQNLEKPLAITSISRHHIKCKLLKNEILRIRNKSHLLDQLYSIDFLFFCISQLKGRIYDIIFKFKL